jgi:hypothetical protein
MQYAHFRKSDLTHHRTRGNTMKTVDIRKFQRPITAFVKESLETFSEENPETQICTVALHGDAFYGMVYLSVDTPENCAEYVRKWGKEMPVGIDEAGKYCENIGDMIEVATFRLPGYPDNFAPIGKEQPPNDFITIDGSKRRVEEGEGDEAMNILLLPLLKMILAEFEPFDQLRRAAPFRAGVYMKEEPS